MARTGQYNGNVAQSQTDSVVAAAKTGYSVRVKGFILSAGATATAVTFNSKGSGAGTAASPTYTAPANNVAASGLNPNGWFDANKNEGLTVTTGAGSTVGISVEWEYVRTG